MNSYYGGYGGYQGTSSMMGRMDPVKITLGVLVLLLAGAAGYLAYKYNSQCAGANGVTCSGTDVDLLEGGVCTAKVKSCGEGTPDKDGVCKYSASSASGDGGFSLGTTGIIGIVVAGVLLLLGSGIFGLRSAVARERAKYSNLASDQPLYTGREDPLTAGQRVLRQSEAIGWSAAALGSKAYNSIFNRKKASKASGSGGGV